MTDQMREMIAQLMGSEHTEEHGKPGIPYDHPSVCRAYLLGICPHDLVPDSRLQSIVTCRKVHEPAHKADYEKAQKSRDHFYDVDAFDIVENAVRQVDNEISRIKEKLDREIKNQTSVAEDNKAQKIAEIEEKIKTQLEEIEKLGYEGRIEESMRVTKNVEDMRERIAEIEAQSDLKSAGGSNSSKLRVCDDCGAQLNVMDHESRIADHYNGKMHMGMVETRETYNKMKEYIDDRRREREDRIGFRGSSRYGRSDRERDYYRRDRGDYRDRKDHRYRDRSRSRDRRDRSRMEDKPRDRHRDRRH